jgi:serine/threonine protein kinase
VSEIDAHLASSLSRRFRLIRQLGAGGMGAVGMGAVFLAEQIAVGNRPVALKVLSRKLLDDPDSCCAFRMKRLPRAAFTTPTSSPFTNPARPMTACPTSPWNFWKARRTTRHCGKG